jgi:hypothetical protein
MRSFQISAEDDVYQVWTNYFGQYHKEDGPAFFNRATKRGSYYICDINVNKSEFVRYMKTKELPLISRSGTEHYINENGKLHNLYGYALFSRKLGVKKYFIDGVVYKDFDEYDRLRRGLIKYMVLFFARKIKVMQKLVEIPELWQEVYYTHKNDFTTISRKV